MTNHPLPPTPATRYLDLSDNALTGPVPGALATLPSLQYLGLGGNKLSGGLSSFADALPPLSPLLGLNMSGNLITGESKGTCMLPGNSSLQGALGGDAAKQGE